MFYQQQPAPQSYFNNVATQQPQKLPQMTAQNVPQAPVILGSSSMMLECPNCHAKGMSKTEYVTGNCTQ